MKLFKTTTLIAAFLFFQGIMWAQEKMEETEIHRI